MGRWVLGELDLVSLLPWTYAFGQSCTILALASRTSPLVRLSSKGIQRSEYSSTAEPPVHSNLVQGYLRLSVFWIPLRWSWQGRPGFRTWLCEPEVLPRLLAYRSYSTSKSEEPGSHPTRGGKRFPHRYSTTKPAITWHYIPARDLTNGSPP
jgi:hypothetical protein